ncbi:nucleoside 2-deoxyribosyltransferase [Burkholderia sp. WP9]|uniref:nucleoside 2-deoxyribosyltransferase n=1 Tax=Burkholderia sp. WP9 TaxID=1500263 RepID=UPI000B88BC3B|nr:nucleoside 2-deoxyribosyltransferase [Burkholderia sp. WP9]
MKKSLFKPFARPLPHRPKFYLASPLFSPAERLLNTELCTLLETAGGVYLPQRDGALVESLRLGSDRDDAAICQQVFVHDTNALEEADVIVAVLDGRALDEGVCIELGYGKAVGAFVVGYKTDIRTVLPWGQNPMLSGCVDVWVHSKEELSRWVVSAFEGREDM